MATLKGREVVFGWGLLVGSLIAAPINVYLYVAKIIDESDLILVTLVLSWLALTFTAWDIVKTSRAARDLDEENS